MFDVTDVDPTQKEHKASCPIAVFAEPVVLYRSALLPTAVLQLPDMLFNIESEPSERL